MFGNGVGLLEVGGVTMTRASSMLRGGYHD